MPTSIQTPFAYLIVMEDMADQVVFPEERIETTWDMAVEQVTTLARLHSRFYESPELGTQTLPFKQWPQWWADMIAGAPRYPEFCDRAFGDAEGVVALAYSAGAPAFRLQRTLPWCDIGAASHSSALGSSFQELVHLAGWAAWFK